METGARVEAHIPGATEQRIRTVIQAADIAADVVERMLPHGAERPVPNTISQEDAERYDQARAAAARQTQDRLVEEQRMQAEAGRDAARLVARPASYPIGNPQQGGLN